MNTFIPLEKLSDTDLSEFQEVWLTSQETHPQDPSHEHSVCLWRVDRVLTQDVEIDESYFQALPCLWLRVDALTDKPAIEHVQHALKARLDEQGLTGEFFPEKQVEQDNEARDLRS
ncbi:hypothetical protein [Pseudomonas huanghezhanensis]|uniref:hypothetical protein n=1 Tax=Pseudomonas huanghezhanensis TaxID=3002903 RepID=UPI0022855381|nr:hypothetical protein [Pseudomonas sp. BSw22131]